MMCQMETAAFRSPLAREREACQGSCLHGTGARTGLHSALGGTVVPHEGRSKCFIPVPGGKRAFPPQGVIKSLWAWPAPVNQAFLFSIFAIPLFFQGIWDSMVLPTSISPSQQRCKVG